MEKDKIENKNALVPYIEKADVALDVVREEAKEKNDALAIILERIDKLEHRKSEEIVQQEKREMAVMKERVVDIIEAARDVEKNYLVPGKQRFKRMVKLRKALDKFEEQFETKTIK